MSAKERASTGCSDRGAPLPKHRRPNEHSAMSAKPATQTTGPAVATSQPAPEVRGRTSHSFANAGPGTQPQAAHAADQVITVQPLLLRLPTVMRITGLARSTIYKLISQGQFPVPIKLSKRAVAWLQSEVECWATTRVRTH